MSSYSYSLFRAEWEKIAGNRWAVAFFIWIFPMGVLIFSILAIIIMLVSEEARQGQAIIGIAPWNITLLMSWSFPNSEVGRWLIVAFSAVVFAGEYQHGTWKNLIPRRRRVTLILNKFITVGVFVTVAFLAMSLIFGIGTGIIAVIIGVGYGTVDGETVRQFAGDYLLQMTITLTATLIAASYAALAAMFTRHILGSAFVGVLLTVAENGILILLFMMQNFLNISALFIYQFTPTFNLANISHWVQFGQGYVPILELPVISLWTSLFIVAVWVVGLISLTTYLFTRQDITT